MARGNASKRTGIAVLPTPAPELARHFDRLSLHRQKSTANSNSGCLTSRVDVIRKDSKVAGQLEGCLSRSKLYAFLQPPTGDLCGLRMLVADNTGLVVAAAGIRADGRLQNQLPMAKMLYPRDGILASYEDDAGNRLVGGLAYKITRAIMQPIEALSRGAKRIAAGHVEPQIPLPANNDDELGLLTRTFNSMMTKLRSNQLEIEQDRVRLGEKNQELQRANETLAQLSIPDGLTKLHNHRYFQDHLTREIKRVSRTQSSLALILLDIDDFKLLNDTHGHAAGDEVLVCLAAIMNDSARESDLIARYGGEEFVILMPNTDLAGAVHLAEKIRMAVESTRLIIGDTMKPVDITISLGVALFNGHRREFFAEADKALYQAKAAGKNCVIIPGSESVELG